MADIKHLNRLLKGIEGWNEWRKRNYKVEPDLTGANLTLKNLRGANLSRTDLSQANLAGTNSVKANFSRANLTNANFMEADCAGANLSRADLTNACFIGTYLNAVDLTGAIMRKASLGRSIMARTKLIDIDLSTVSGLDKVAHKTPSSIGIDTIYRSKGKIPPEFLRGAGVPDNFIEYMSSLTGKALEYYSCFISYSSKDQEFSERLFADLQSNGVRCWFAPHHVQGGKKLYEQIDDAIRVHERLLLVLSPSSIGSEWVKTEIAKARQREVKEKKRVLFPVRVGIDFEQLRDWEYFDADIGKSSSREIREYYIPDFSQWKSHDAYQIEFNKLLRDLKKADSQAAGA